MKKFLNIIDAKKAEYLIELGFRAREEIIEMNGKDKTVWIFVEDDKLFRILNDRKLFSKKDYFYSNIMKF